MPKLHTTAVCFIWVLVTCNRIVWDTDSCSQVCPLTIFSESNIISALMALMRYPFSIRCIRAHLLAGKCPQLSHNLGLLRKFEIYWRKHGQQIHARVAMFTLFAPACSTFWAMIAWSQEERTAQTYISWRRSPIAWGMNLHSMCINSLV